jgi:hypothetical protein
MDNYTYFGYGSNMLLKKLRSRCPSVDVIGVCRTKGYTLKFHKVSTDESGKGDMVEAKSGADELYGIAFIIDKSDGSNLDRAEGYGQGYKKKEFFVEALDVGCVLGVGVYYATKIDSKLEPYCWYKKQVVQGARENGLPEDYIKKIEADFPCIQDHDPDRVAKNEKYLS